MGNDHTAPLPFDDPPAADNSAQGPRLHFLGSCSPLPDLAARWVLAESQSAGDTPLIVALPGSRAQAAVLGALQRELAQSPSAHWPNLLTVGQLGDSLALPSVAELSRAPELAAGAPGVAGRLLRSLEWQRALNDLPDAARQLLLPDAADSPSARRALAASLRGLHADLAAADLDGDDVAEARDSIGPDGERWLLFADLQRRVMRALASRGLSDPHVRRRASLDLAARAIPRVVLVGVVDISPLLERQLARRVEHIDLLLPGEHATHAEWHDEWGRLQPEVVSRHGLPGLLQRWKVLQNPAAQAESLAAACEPQTELVLPDRELHAPLRRRLSARGLSMHDTAGRSWQRSPLARFLEALREHFERRSAASFAALIRQPVLEAWFRSHGTSGLARAFDGYHEAHLPVRLPRHWRSLPMGQRGSKHSAERAQVLKVGRQTLGDLLGVFGENAAREPAELLAALRSTLVELSANQAGAELLAGAAAARFREVLEQADELPNDAPMLPAELLQRLADALSDAATEVAQGGASVELVSVGDLSFSSAPAVLLGGFNEGSLPATLRRHPWLPDSLCQELGLPHVAARCAREHWALLGALARGVDLQLHSGRQGREGDPRRASRLAFTGPDDQALLAARHAMAELEPQGVEDQAHSGPVPAALLRAELPVIESLSVTTFDAFLSSPYQCYVQRILRRHSQNDAAHELDGGAFGTLAHELLEAFGRSELRDSTDPEALLEWFDDSLEQLRQRRFGNEVAPAVTLQLHQLGWRLRHFARFQAQHAAAGWRIAHVEWSPESPVKRKLGGESINLHGRIDRIDINESTGEWLLLDYKTGEKGDSPNTDHGGKKGVWKKLQLPLYLELIEELQSEWERFDEPQLGYLVLPKSRNAESLLRADWSAEQLANARATAGEIVRRLRAGEVAALGAGRFLTEDPSLRALSGLGLVGGPRTQSLGALIPEVES